MGRGSPGNTYMLVYAINILGRIHRKLASMVTSGKGENGRKGLEEDSFFTL